MEFISPWFKLWYPKTRLSLPINRIMAFLSCTHGARPHSDRLFHSLSAGIWQLASTVPGSTMQRSVIFKGCNDIIIQRQNMASAQLPQTTCSQAGKPEVFEFRPQSQLTSLSGNISIVQARDTLSRRSYQPIVLASLWWRLWSPAAN